MSYYAGIDLGGTNIKCGIVDEEGNIIVQESVPTHREKGFSYVTETMAGLVIKLARETKIDVKAVGVGSPGMIDGERGVVVYSNNLAWQKAPLAAELKNGLRIPVRITNDANAAAYGEYTCGAGKQYNSIVLLTLGTGVGSGIVIDGKLFEGNRGAGAESGHETIRFGGEKCTCGRRGCLEAYASATACRTHSALTAGIFRRPNGGLRRSLRCARSIARRQAASSPDPMRGGAGAAASRDRSRTTTASTSRAIMPRLGQFASCTRWGLDLSRE